MASISETRSQPLLRMKNLIVAILFVVPSILIASTTFVRIEPMNILQEGGNQEGYPNASDAKGRQGMWTIWGRMSPEKGYPPDGKIEEGPYKDGRKEGEWVKFHIDGKTPRLKWMYIDNRPNGPYTKYYENGIAMEEGKFTSGKQVEVFRRYYDTGVLSQEKYFNQEGREDGEVKYYYPNGQLEFQYMKVDGVTTGQATRYYENGDVKEIIMYNYDGSIASRIEKEMVNPPVNTQPVSTAPSSSAPDGRKGTTNGKKFKEDGYNKVYNSDQELWMDGEFKDGKLMDGKLYKYDSDGILLKIEVWKNGKYHSDGQLQ